VANTLKRRNSQQLRHRSRGRLLAFFLAKSGLAKGEAKGISLNGIKPMVARSRFTSGATQLSVAGLISILFYRRSFHRKKTREDMMPVARN